MKKNLIILVAVLLTSTFAFAQSGNMFVTGNLGFKTNSKTNTVGSTSVDVPGGNSFDIMAEFHYKLTKNIAVGLGLDYESSTSYVSTTPNGTDYFDSESMFSIVPSVIYGIKITDNFKYIPRLYVAIGFGSRDEEQPDLPLNPNTIETFTTDLSSFSIGVKPLSFEYGINNRFAITMSFGDLYYRTYTEKATVANTEVKSTDKAFNLDANYGASFGIRIYL